MINKDLLLKTVTCKIGTFEEAMYTKKTGKLICRERTKNKTNVQERENKNHAAPERGGRPGGSWSGVPGPCEARSCLLPWDPEFNLRLYNNAFGF